MSDQSQLTAIALKKSGGLKSNPSVKSINSKKKSSKANNLSSNQKQVRKDRSLSVAAQQMEDPTVFDGYKLSMLPQITSSQKHMDDLSDGYDA